MRLDRPALSSDADKEFLVRFKRSFVVLVLTLFLATVTHPSMDTTVAAGPFVQGQVLVKFKPGTPSNAKANSHTLAGGAPQREIGGIGVQVGRHVARR